KDPYDFEFHAWYLKMRECLEEKLLVVLKETGVFEKKNIDSTKYKISFRKANHVPKQGIWYLEIFLCTVLLHSNNSKLSQDGECCFFLGFVSSGCLLQWSSIFTDRSDKGFLVRVDQERIVKRVPTSSHMRGVTIMVSEPGYETVGSKDLTCEDWMVNTRTDADLSAAVQNALQTLLPQIRVEIREEFRTSSGPSDAGRNPPLISHMEKIFDVMGCEDAFKTRLVVYKFEGNALAWWKANKQAKGCDAWLVTMTWPDFKKLFFLQFFPRAEQERLKREYHSIRQTNTETSTEFLQRFLRLAGFLGAAAGTEEEQAKNFQWVLRRSTLNHLLCLSYMDVAQVANAARNYEILHERDDDDTERPDS
nr:hypothetical protein [Tanacetum cinerariifolium]